MQKYLLILSLCFCATIADDFAGRHYNQHQQTVEQARRKFGDTYGSSYEEIGSYGGGTVGISGGDSSINDFAVGGGGGSISGLADFASSGSSAFDASQSHSSNFASSSSASFGSSSNSVGSLTSGTSMVIPTAVVSGGGSNGHESLFHEEHHSENIPSSIVYSHPSGSENYYHEERHVTNKAATPIIHYAPSGGSEKYIHHEEHHVQPAATLVTYTPSGGSEKYIHIKEEQHVQPIQVVLSAPSGGGHESYVKYKKVTSSSAPLVVMPTGSTSSILHETSSSGTNLGSLTGITSGNLISGGFNSGGLSSGSFLSGGLNSGLSSGLSSSNQMSSSMTSGSQISNSMSSGSHMSGNLANSLGFHHGSTGIGSANLFNHGGSFGSLGSESHFGASLGSSSNLHSYMSEAERLAKLQTQGINVGGIRNGGSQINDFNLSNNFGGAGNGYKTKSWEKNSKWSSQSEFGSDGQVKNFKELSTGESENYDINGRHAGYKAATATVDDNGKLSSYSLYT